MQKIVRNFALSGIGFLAAMGSAQAQRNVEQPQYEVLKRSAGVELRQYAPQIVAEVKVKAGSLGEASSNGFRPLAAYIFGDNKGAGRIAMTAPVTAQAEPMKIAMTAPVTTAKNEDGVYTVRFSMPSKWTMDTLPIPNNENVKLVELAPEIRVAYRLVGTRSQERADEAIAKIDTFIASEGLEAVRPIMTAGYDGPSVPINEKRWEIMRIVTCK